MVNKERVALWADELINGDWQQGNGKLRVDDKYCCLGVACEVAIANGCVMPVGEYTTEDEDDGGPIIYGYGVVEQAYYLPREAMEWYGFDQNDPVIKFVQNNPPTRAARPGENAIWTASFANDDAHSSLREIGQMVKEFYLEGNGDGE
jgi:hypothetical protein